MRRGFFFSHLCLGRARVTVGRKREEKKRRRRKKEEEENPGLEVWNSCLEVWKFLIHVWDFGLELLYGFAG